MRAGKRRRQWRQPQGSRLREKTTGASVPRGSSRLSRGTSLKARARLAARCSARRLCRANIAPLRLFARWRQRSGPDDYDPQRHSARGPGLSAAPLALRSAADSVALDPQSLWH